MSLGHAIEFSSKILRPHHIFYFFYQRSTCGDSALSFVFSSPPQGSMTSNFEGFSYQILSINFYTILINLQNSQCLYRSSELYCLYRSSELQCLYQFSELQCLYQSSELQRLCQSSKLLYQSSELQSLYQPVFHPNCNNVRIMVNKVHFYNPRYSTESIYRVFVSLTWIFSSKFFH